MDVLLQHWNRAVWILRTIMKKRTIKLIFGGICFILIALCVLYFHIDKKAQTPQVMNETYSHVINKDGHIIDMSCAKLERFTEEDFVDIAYPRFNAEDEASHKMNEQIYHAMIAGDILEDDGYADRAEIKYEVPYADDRIISIHFTGYKGKGFGNENLDMGMNFDLSSGELLCLADFYGLKELRDLLENAVEEGKLSVMGLPINDSEKTAYIDSFLDEFASDDYINETDNFYLQENRICFLAEPYLSMKQKVCLALEVDALSAIQRSRGNDETRAAGNTAEGNESALAEDFGGQASVEKSDEADTFNEAEASKEAEGTAFVFDHWLDFAGTDFSEEWGIPYVDDETFEVIKKAYEQVDFFGEFESGNEAVYDEYKEKYKELLENDGLVFDEKAGTSIPFSQIDDIGRYMERNETVYYFFDIDGDDLPELSVHIYGQGIYALDYDTEKDAFSVWYPMGSYAYSLIGTRKVQWHGNGHWLAFYLLDESGEEACYTFFFGMQKSAESYLAAAMMPKYSEKEKNLKLTKAMKSQGIYTRSGSEWYFRITKEQYDELSKPYWEAYDRAEEKKKEVTYTYEELFGGE